MTVIAGAASGGAGLVTKASITSPGQLKGTTLATPQLATLAGGKTLSSRILSAAFGRLTFRVDPLLSTLQTQIVHGEQVGLLQDPGSVGPMADPQPLSTVLAAAHQAPVNG